MEEEVKINLGRLTIIIDTPLGLHPSTNEVTAQVQATLASIERAIERRQYPFRVEFRVISASYGCIKLVVMLVAVIAAPAMFAAKYHVFRDDLPNIIGEAEAIPVQFAPEKRCRPTLHTNELTRRAYEVKPGDTVARVIKVWSRPKGVSERRMMQAIVWQNPHAFVNGDPNQLRSGTALVYPTEDAFKGICT